jgi:hypothetical protein
MNPLKYIYAENSTFSVFDKVYGIRIPKSRAPPKLITKILCMFKYENFSCIFISCSVLVQNISYLVSAQINCYDLISVVQ